jgi:FkbM family methyltransferase
MEGMVSDASFPKIAAKSLAPDFFTVFDVGCSGGLDSGWRNFGGALRAFGFDPNLADIRRLNEQEENRHVKFVAGFVGVPSDCPGSELMETGSYWDRSPWNRLSVCKTLEIRSAAMKGATDEEKLRLNLWQQTQLANPKKPIILPEFVEENSIDDIDFIKIDVDGADLLILRSIQPILESRKVIGVGIEVNFFGSEEPNVNTFHNVDRTMRKAGFELFDLSLRRYSMAALPCPYIYDFPAQSRTGRPFQGDALYLRDLAAPEFATSGMRSPKKLLKLAALFSLFGQPDSAAEILLHNRDSLSPLIGIDEGMSELLRQAAPKKLAGGYAKYIEEFEKDSPWFYRQIDGGK